jgi:hypothetical protein
LYVLNTNAGVSGAASGSSADSTTFLDFPDNSADAFVQRNVALTVGQVLAASASASASALGAPQQSASDSDFDRCE